MFDGRSGHNVGGCTWLLGKNKLLRGRTKFEVRNGYITMGTVGGYCGGGDCCRLMAGGWSMVKGFGTTREGEMPPVTSTRGFHCIIQPTVCCFPGNLSVACSYIIIVVMDSQKAVVGGSGESDEVLVKDAELGEESEEVLLEVLIREIGEELNTALSVQGWEGSLGTGLIITDVGSSVCSSSFSFDDGEKTSVLPPKSALQMARGRTNFNMTSCMVCTCSNNAPLDPISLP